MASAVTDTVEAPTAECNEDDSRAPKAMRTWVDDLCLIPVEDARGAASHNVKKDSETGFSFSILSFNVLAESYLTRRSHPGLPKRHAEVVFNADRRRKLLVDTLKKFAGQSTSSSRTEQDTRNGTEESQRFDIMCLQEMDLPEIILPEIEQLDYGAVHALKGYSPSSSNTQTPARNSAINKKGISDKADTCAILYCTKTFTLVQSQIIEFDDLAGGPHVELRTKSGISRARKGRGGSPAEGLGGMIQSYRRRNRAVVAVLRHSASGRRICVCSGHLYWHPGYEYVKLSQAKYMTDKVDAMAKEYATEDEERIPVVICGDLNSKPGSAVHQFFVKDSVDARAVAPWHYHGYDGLNETELDKGDRSQPVEKDPHSVDDPVVPLDDDDMEGETNDESVDDNDNLIDKVGELKLADADDYTAMALTADNGIRKIKASAYGSKTIRDTTPHDGDEPTVRYLLDFTLNRFTRWLRILGIDAALETEDEEKARTRDRNPIIFQRCRLEQRTLLTTSKSLLRRKDCPPGAYLIDPKNVQEVEKAMVQLFLDHGVILRPRDFVTRCVICNGSIFTVANDEDKAEIFKANGCPDLKMELSVYACNGCGQGYWWCDDIVTSSASRVKMQAAHLFRQCLRGGVPVEGGLHMFDFVDIQEERSIGEKEGTLAGKGRPTGPMEPILGWLKEKALTHPFGFRSAYAFLTKDGTERIDGESLPFTNVTADFVDTLDYIFYEPSQFEQTHRVKAPTSFRALNVSGDSGGHLLPSDLWPSDHLLLGCKLVVKSHGKDKAEPVVPVTASSSAVSAAPSPLAGQTWAMPAAHTPNCACGCIPAIPSLFQMAEMRKQARLKAEQAKKEQDLV